MRMIQLLALSLAYAASEPLTWGAGPNSTAGIRCGVGGDPNGQVVQFTDGSQQRCMSIISPPSNASTSKLPVLFWFHGHGGNAAECDRNPLAALAKQHGFALVCGEAVQTARGGSWNVPHVITDTTGTPCRDSDSYDRPYIKNALRRLEQLGSFDTTRVFFSGCSQGSGFSTYTSTCTKQDSETAEHISAFATHSTGLKIKGDNITWDCCSDIESCEECQYFPAKPFAVPAADLLGLKACVFDNMEDRLPPDPTSNNPFFYLSSKQLAAHWSALGNKVEAHFKSGGHCQDIAHYSSNVL